MLHPTSVIRKNPYWIEPELIRRQKEDKFLIRNYQELILDPKLWPGLNRWQNLLIRPENSWFPYHWGRTSRLPLFGPEFRNNRPKRPLFAQFWLVLALFWFFCKRQKISEKNGASCDLQNWRPNVTQLVLPILWRTSTENFILERYIFPGTKLEKPPYLLNGWSICFEPLRLILGLVPTWPYILSLNVSGEHLWN